MKACFVCGMAILLSVNSRAGEKVVDLILVAGQSNAVGFDARAGDLPEDPRDRAVMFWWRGGDTPADEHDSSFNQEWVPLQTQPKGNPKPGRPGNFASAEGGFGPEMAFARTLLDHQPDRPLAIVKVAYSASGIRSWQPGASLYKALMQETNLAIEKAREQGVTLRPRALVWCQGESDSSRHANTENYRKALETMISALRKDLDAPELVALVGFNTAFGLKQAQKKRGPSENVLKTVAAQKAVADGSEYVEYVDDWGCQVVNVAHFGSAGTLELGKRYAEALLRVEAKLKGASR